MTNDHRARTQPTSLRQAIGDLIVASISLGERIESRRPEIRWVTTLTLTAAAAWAFVASDSSTGLRALAWMLGVLALGALTSSLVAMWWRR